MKHLGRLNREPAKGNPSTRQGWNPLPRPSLTDHVRFPVRSAQARSFHTINAIFSVICSIKPVRAGRVSALRALQARQSVKRDLKADADGCFLQCLQSRQHQPGSDAIAGDDAGSP